MQRVPGPVLALSLCLTAPGWAQAGANWNRVKQLQAGTQVRVQQLHGTTRARHLACAIESVDEEKLVCTRTHSAFFVPIVRRYEIPRPEVLQVRLTRPLASTVGGLAIGAGLGVGIGYATQSNADRAEDPGLLPAALGLVFAPLGAGLGRGSDFLGGPVIYRVP